MAPNRFARISPFLAALAAALAAAHAFAQSKDIDEDDVEIDSAPEGSKDMEASEKPQEGVPTLDTYTVKQGDTLWDISGRYMNSPWYWPKVWSFNPHISNPHWIEPGTQVQFYPTGEFGALEEDLATGEPVEELPDVQKVVIGAAADTGGGDRDVLVTAGRRIIGIDDPNQMLVRRDMFISARQIQEAGSVRFSANERAMLGEYDECYLRFRNLGNVKIGDRFLVVKEPKEVYASEDDDEPLGYSVRYAGEVQILKIDSRFAKAVVYRLHGEPVERGDKVIPLIENLGRVQRMPNKVNLKARIVYSINDPSLMIGDYTVVFIDKGIKDGVETGNLFTAWRRGDPSKVDFDDDDEEDQEFLPKEIIGSVLIIDAREKISTGLVTRAVTELRRGTNLEMISQN